MTGAILTLLAAGLATVPNVLRAASETFTYDNAGRLIKVEHGDGRVTDYSLDPAGNRTNVTTGIPGSPGTLSIVTSGGTYPEAHGAVSVVLRRSNGTAGAASVTVALSFTGSATSSDASVTPATVSWAANDASDKSVTVTIVNDTAIESSETFNLVISGASGASLGSPSSITFTITDDDQDVTPPTTPTNLVATSISSSQINLTWTASSDTNGIAQYRIERCTGSGCSNFAQVATSTTNSFSSTGLAENVSYTYRVRAVDGQGLVSAYSGSATAATQDATVPTAPTNLTATAISATQINLGWTAATDANGISQYRIERCAGAGCSNFSQIATTTSTGYNNTGLSEYTSYSYRVRAVDGASNVGPYSSNVTRLTLDVTAPAAPSGLVASAASATQINLSWNAPSDASGISQYRIERCSGSGCSNFSQITTTTSTTFSNTGLSETTSYSYRVRAVDGSSNVGGYSGNATAVTLDVTAPAAPTNFAASAASGSQINLSWTAPSDVSGISQYRIERCSGAGCSNFSQIATTTSTSYSNTGLTEITSYSYRVRAVDGANNVGSYTSVATAVTRDVTGPSAPGNFTATAVSANRVDLSWSAANDNVGVQGYRIQRCPNANCSNFSQVGTTSAGTLSFSDTSTAQVTLYRYRVYAVDAVPNTGAYSAVAQVTTPDGTPPSVPQSLGASVVSPNRIDLSWQASSDNVGVAGYKVYRNGSAVTTTSGTSYSDAVLQPSTTYTFRVSALDAAGNESGLSNTVQATTQPIPDTTPPTAPTNLTGSAASSSQVNLSWNVSTDSGGSGLAGYRVYRNGSLLATVGVSAFPTYTDNSTTGMTTYSYVVYAYDNAQLQSTASNTVSITPPDQTPPTAPTNLTATAVNGSTVNLSWTASTDQGGSGLHSYSIRRNGTQVTTATAPATSKTDSSATAGTTYTYVVRARDGSGNWSGDSNSVTLTTPNVLTVALNKTTWTWMKTGNMSPIVASPVVVTPSGGAGSYTYQWERVVQSGDDASTNVSSPTSASTIWNRSNIPNSNVQFISHWRCKVTDGAGAFVYTATVTVSFTRNTLE